LVIFKSADSECTELEQSDYSESVAISFSCTTF